MLAARLLKSVDAMVLNYDQSCLFPARKLLRIDVWIALFRRRRPLQPGPRLRWWICTKVADHALPRWGFEDLYHFLGCIVVFPGEFNEDMRKIRRDGVYLYSQFQLTYSLVRPRAITCRLHLYAPCACRVEA